MFAIVKNNQVVQYIQPHGAFHVNWVEYGANWIATATQEQKDAIGLVDVVHGPRKDERFYWVTQQEPVYNAGAKRVEINFTDTPKDLAPLKTQWIAQTKATANSLLAQTDWMVIRKAERDIAIPLDVVAARGAIILDQDSKQQAIEAATTVEQLIAAVQN